jgi:hypothetical protein
MEIPNIEIFTFNGEKLFLKGDFEKIVKILKKNGYLFFKRVIDLSIIEFILLNNRNSLGYVRRDIVLNKMNSCSIFENLS